MSLSGTKSQVRQLLGVQYLVDFEESLAVVFE